jgi:glycosyltransferase involved in cell wall biosynthesis
MEVIANLATTQNNLDYEVVVVNDGSVNPDNTHKPFKYPNITIVNNKNQRGVGYCFDRGVEASSGDIIVLMGSDVFVRRKTWLNDVIDAVNNYPNTIGCAVSLGLHGNERDLDKEGINKRYGARLLVTLDKDDFPPDSEKIKKNPAHREIWEAKWINEKLSDEPYEIPCALGAFYFTTKAYYEKIGGWDTSPNNHFQGHMRYGGLEPFISLKSWLYGGGVTLFPNIEAGHVFSRRTRDNKYKIRSGKPSLHWWNRLWITETMVFDERLRKQIMNFCPPELNLNKAKSYIRQNYNTIIAFRERNENIFIHDFKWFCEKFDVKIK